MTAATTTAVTFVAGGTYQLLPHGSGQPITIAGTSNGGGSVLDVRCYGGDSYVELGTVTTDAGGGWTLAAPPVQYTRCVLRAVPSDADGNDLVPSADLSSFRSLDLSVGGTSVTTGADTSGIPVFDTAAPQVEGTNGLSSADGCAVDSMYVTDDSTAEPVGDVGGCLGALGLDDSFTVPSGPPGSSGSSAPQNDRAGMIVDGRPAMVPASAGRLAAGIFFSSLPTPSYAVSQDPSSGDVTVTESQPLVHCAEASYLPASPSCHTFVGAGLRLDRTTTQTARGSTVVVGDSFVSTDGLPHTVDAEYADQWRVGAPSFGFSWIDAGALGAGLPPGATLPLPGKPSTPSP